MASTPNSGKSGFGLSKSDMDASRLVFVFLRDAKPKRKMAVPIPDDYTWQDFIQQIRIKLKLVGITAVYLAATGELVERLDQLQDIDELCVVETPSTASTSGYGSGARGPEASVRSSAHTATSEIAPANGDMPATPMNRNQGGQLHSLRIGMDTGSSGVGSSSYSADDEKKYARRVHPLKRTLQRFLPGMFVPSRLPVTMKDVIEGPAADRAKAARRMRRSLLDPRNILLLLAVVSACATIVFYIRVVSKVQTPH